MTDNALAFQCLSGVDTNNYESTNHQNRSIEVCGGLEQ